MSLDRADLVLEGGGAKGIGLVGAVARLQRDLTVERAAGTSAGAIVASLVAAGYASDELRTALFEFPFRKVAQRDLLDWVPVAGPLLSLTFERGVFETDAVRDHLAGLLAAKGVETFGDLRRDDPGSSLAPDLEYRLVVTATDLTAGELLYLPWDYDRFGLDPDEQSVADAVTASISIPLFFEPQYLHDAEGTRHVLVDGGVLSNYPISVFDRTDGQPPRWPTFGVKIIPRLPEESSRLFPLLGVLPIPGLRQIEALVATLIVGRDQTFLARPCVHARTIEVDTEGVGVLDFWLSDEQKAELYANGLVATDAFLAGFDWDAYLARCRPTRRPTHRSPRRSASAQAP